MGGPWLFLIDTVGGPMSWCFHVYTENPNDIEVLLVVDVYNIEG